ncbi:pyridoxal 5'-phosphate synthase glutaminase subunit PdxT [Saccharopolyspora halophila]|uniref:Pyridoxal 5'-phosphate synthase subunit PdxT n=1 Tax=Saccharopolyspora halophila TaxID=405551 RepID=A0ABN3G7Q9_9PSEU
MGTPVVGVLALQGGVAEHLAALERSGARARPVRRAEELDGLHGIVLPGGESTTMSRLLDVFELHEPLREKLAGGLPAYGSCAGMIMLSGAVCDGGDGAAAPAVRPLGALDVSVRRNAFGRQVDSFETDLEFAGIDGQVHAVFIRAPWVDKIGDGVSVLAVVPEGPDVSERSEAAGRIVAVQQGAVLATAFHPELVAGDERVHRYFVQIVRAR